jgi:5-methylcytosine-specific restriction endonuclease McrA
MRRVTARGQRKGSIGHPRRKAWARMYRSRMDAGWEHCRNCGSTDPGSLTWGHIVPRARGGNFTSDNITILCWLCNQQQGPSIWHHLTPLCQEPDFEEIAFVDACAIDDVRHPPTEVAHTEMALS